METILWILGPVVVVVFGYMLYNGTICMPKWGWYLLVGVVVVVLLLYQLVFVI